MASLLWLLQLCDSAFPIGSYSQSWGLETWVQRGLLTNAAQVEEAIRILLTTSIAPQDGAACALAHCYHQDIAVLARIDSILTASRWPIELSQASQRLGARLRDLFADHPFPLTSTHHCLVFGWLTAQLAIPQADAVQAYLLSSTNSLVSAAVRLVPLGHTQGQKILFALHQDIEKLLPGCIAAQQEEIGSFAPLHEWASDEHQRLYSRLFQS
jgi:urease accessory protein